MSARIAVVLALVVAASPVRAQPSRNEAKALFEAASRSYDMGQYDDAAAGFRRAYELTGSPEVLFNIGQAYRLAKKYEDALLFYRSFLRRSANPSSRTDVEKRITELEEIIARQQREAAAPPTGLSPPPPSATAEPPQQPEPPVARRPPSATAPAPSLAVIAAAAPDGRGRVLRRAGYALLGIAGGAAIVGGALTGVSQATQTSLEEAARHHEPYTPASQELEAAGRTQATVGVALLAVAGAVAIAGAATTAVGHTARRAPRAQLTPHVGVGSLAFVVEGAF